MTEQRIWRLPVLNPQAYDRIPKGAGDRQSIRI